MSHSPIDINTTITMLGGPGMGKTCFLVGMYAIMREGQGGFTFSTDLDTDLKLDGYWNQLIEGNEKRWPQANNSTPIPYSFLFNYGFRKIIGFDWLDYRGGALSDSSKEADVQELIGRMCRSSCVLLCVSGRHLVQAGHDAKARAEARIPRINAFLQQLRESVERSGQRLPAVVIVVTKYDYCADRPTSELIAQVRNLFSPLFAPGAGWLTTICPVTLGEELATNPDSGTIEPQNIHLPVTFAAYNIIQQEAEGLEAELRSRQQKLDSRRSKIGTAQGKVNTLGSNMLKRWWNSDEIAQNEAEIRELREQVDED